VGLAEGDVPSDRDFTFSFTPAASTAPVASLLKEHVGDSDYLLALVVPPGGEARSKAKPREAIFILDNSGSMAGSRSARHAPVSCSRSTVSPLPTASTSSASTTP
jgi:Ca-activated chloride channel family protein